MSKLLTPAELGMPEKYADSGWRPVQEAALEWMLRSTKRTVAPCAPTGSGKQGLAVGYALMTGEPTAIVTDSRGLQDQYMEEFSSIGMVDIRGRRNYECGLKPDYTCEDGYQAQCPYRGTHNCPSTVAENRAAASPLVVTNYDKWCSAKKYGTGLKHIRRVVFDEGHEAPNALARAMQVIINHRERERHICLDPPSDVVSMVAWRVWAVEARAVIEGELKRALDALRGVSDPSPTKVRHALHMRNLNRKLGILATAKPDNWVAEERLDGDSKSLGFVFDAVRPARYAESALLFRVPHVVVMSATLRPKTLFMVGQGSDTFDFHEFDSDFDPNDNPIYWVPTMRVDSKTTNFHPLWNRLDQIAARRRDRNGIVHTVSYARRDAVVGSSRFGASMLLNPRGDAPSELVEQYKLSPAGTILVSPSVGQGYDFPGPTCEWQFLCKIPFPPPSAILKARTEDDPEYRHYLAMLKMVQTFGRGARFRGDRCENFLPDDHIEWFLPRYGHLAPRTFHRVFKRADILPPPPAALRK